jgi:hypothetical protein
MADNNAVFTEVLEVQVDTSEFASGLQKLTDVYTQWLQSLPKGVSANEILGVGGLTTFNAELTELTAHLKAFTEAFRDGFGAVGAQIKEGLDATTKQELEKIDEVTAAHKKAEETREKIRFQANERRLALETKATHEVVNNREAVKAAEAKQAEVMEAAQVKLANVSAAAATARGVADKAAADLSAITASNASTRIVDAYKKTADAAKVYAQERIAAEEKYAAVVQALATGTSKIQVTELKRVASETERSANNAQRSYERLATKQEALVAQGSVLQRAFSRFVKDIPEFASMIFRLTLGLQISYTIINAIISVIGLIPKAFQEGWTWLNQIADQAAELQGVLAGNVRFSEDFVKNYEMAGKAARQVAEAIQDTAFVTGQSIQTIDTAFKAFIEGGGQNFTHNLQESVQLVGLLAQGMHTVVPPTRVMRQLTEELPKLLSGNLGPTSKFGELLNMSQKDLQKLVKDAEKHHDLLQRLAPALSAFTKVQDEASGRQSVLNNQIENMRQRAMALVAEPIWKMWTDLLQKAKEYFAAHHTQISAILSTVGHLIEATLRFVGALGRSVLVVPGIVEGFKAMGIVLLALVEAVSLFLRGLTSSLNIFSGFVALLASGKALSKDAWASFWQDAKKEGSKFFDETEQGILRLSDVIHGTKLSRAAQGDGTEFLSLDVTGSTKPGDPPKTKFDNKPLQHLREEYAKELAKLRNEAAAQLKDINDKLEAGVLDAKEAGIARSNILGNEHVVLDALIKKYAELASKVKGASPDAKTSFLNHLATDKEQGNRLSDESLEALKKGNTDQANEQARHNARMRALKQDAARQQAQVERVGLEAIGALRSTILRQQFADEKKAVTDRIKEIDREVKERKLVGEKLNRLMEERKQASDKLAAAEKKNEIEVRAALEVEARERRGNVITSIQQHISTLEHQLALERTLYGESMRAKAIEAQIAHERVKLTQATIDQTNAEIDLLLVKAAEANDAATILHIQDEIDKRNELIKTLKAQQEAQEGAAGKAEGKTGFFGGIADKLDLSFKGFQNSVESLGKIFDKVTGVIGAVQQGVQQGGTLGGIGAGLSAVGGMIPGPVGAVMSFAGSIMSMIGGLFKKAAERIAKQIAKELSNIMKDYQQGTTNLVDTIARLEAERTKAISQLSGKKGGKEQLDKLLPQIDDQIASLKKTQADIKEKFESTLAVMRLHSDVLGNVLKTWQDINKQVKEYLGAGGDKNKAAEMLSLTLQKLKEDTQTSLAEGEQEAIKDALNLNDLIKQRIELINDEKKAEFDLINGDALEKRRAPAIEAGRELAKKRADFKGQLDDLNSQIDLETIKVNRERDVFHLATDIAALHRRDEELTLNALDAQIKAWLQMQALVAGIVQGPNGLFGMTTTLQRMLGLTPTAAAGGTSASSLFRYLPNPDAGGQFTQIGTLTVNMQLNGVTDATRVVDALDLEITRRYRSGRQSYSPVQ